MAVYELDGVAPQVDASAWVADSAQVIGDVKLAADVSLWFGCVARGDSAHIAVGAGTNVQDQSMLHADPEWPLTVGARVTVGHRVTLHGCTVGDDTLIGMGATVLNGARIGKHCVVGANALVTEGKTFPDGSLILGAPARVARHLTPPEIEGIQRSAQHYAENARRFRAGLKKIA
ncbi:MAG: gamma carbonic anhydrase family protein [Burkholderiaceae bacterium]|nr:gamma carbonic anhydrase family protein [Burkholderiaceae bacterium]